MVLTPGMGAVATTFIAGVESVRRGLSRPIGSLTQLQTIRLGPRSMGRNPHIHELDPLAPLSDLTFGGWDIFPDDAYEPAGHVAEHYLFIQHLRRENTLRVLPGESPVTHLSEDFDYAPH